MTNTRGFKELQSFLIALYEGERKTLRQIAKEDFDNKVTHGAIDRCIKGIEPRDNEIRKWFGLPLIVTQYKDPVTGRYVNKS